MVVNGEYRECNLTGICIHDRLLDGINNVA